MRARTERLVGALAVVLATGLVLAGIGAADNSKTAPYASSAFNTCNGETVVVEGTIFMDEETTT